MCGIVGYTGRKRAAKILLSGLKALEYRGYDSAGVALSGEKLVVCKCGGRVSQLAEMMPASVARAGIGHTRWATHGAPCAENAHPHLSFDGKIAIVHNGVIENQEELRAELAAKGIPFSSQTDSELIAHLLALESGPMTERMLNVAKRAKGALTFLALRAGDDRIYCHCRGAALVVAAGKGECYVASDVVALAGRAASATVLRDGECAMLSPDGAKITGDGLKNESCKISPTAAAGNGCRMKKEISEIPSALTATRAAFCGGWKGKTEALAALRRADRILFAGCGTAYHACLYASDITERLTGIPCRAMPAGEMEDACFPEGKTVCVFVTQSGETADTLRAMKLCAGHGAFTLAVVNRPASSAAFDSDACLPTDAGTELAVAATKSYCCQLFALRLLAGETAGVPADESFAGELEKGCRAALSLPVDLTLADKQKLFFIGRGTDRITAAEGALKFKEVTWKVAEAYSATELKHGPIALADADSAAVAVLTDRVHLERVKAAVSELRSRGVKVEAYSSVGDVGADITYVLPSLSDCALMPVIAAIPMQKLALGCAIRLGRDPDKPRNLAKSVTVI